VDNPRQVAEKRFFSALVLVYHKYQELSLIANPRANGISREIFGRLMAF